jgi:NAD(P)-dependent dehydrogenase (short-subunit alcohol dehydrogenase family)
MDLKLRGRKALVTGASKGIGLACARLLAREGVDVALASRTSSDLERAKAEILGIANVGVRVFPLDLSQSRSVETLARECADIDILVNNAGAIPGGSIDDVDEARWRAAWDLKVFGYINMTRRFLALMGERGSGVIVNVIGAAGEKLDAGYIAGSVGNASLMALTRALGGDAPRRGVRVVGINPGPVATGRIETLMRKKAKDRWGDEERWAELLKPLPFGRTATTEEIAAMAAFLASDLSGYTSGTIVTIDGGAAHRGAAF